MKCKVQLPAQLVSTVFVWIREIGTLYRIFHHSLNHIFFSSTWYVFGKNLPQLLPQISLFKLLVFSFSYCYFNYFFLSNVCFQRSHCFLVYVNGNKSRKNLERKWWFLVVRGIFDSKITLSSKYPSFLKILYRNVSTSSYVLATLLS